jgi:hypothetical protein
MSFDDRTLRRDDSPKSRVKAILPHAQCFAVYWNGRREGYRVEAEGRLKGSGRSAWDAWRDAEATLSQVDAK